MRTIEPGIKDGWWVESEAEPNRWYWALRLPSGVWTCTCKDFETRGGPCKHAMAARLLEWCLQVERGPEPPPIPFPARTLGDDEPIPYKLTDKGLAATTDAA